MMMNRLNLAVVVTLSAASLLATAQPARATVKTVERDVSEALKAVRVKMHLIEKLGGDALGITVVVSGATATLVGHVSKPASQKLAGQVALSVEGIKKVDNNVTEEQPPGAVAASEAAVRNATLELKVKAVLLGEIGTNAMQIEVDAADGVVSLRGKDIAADTARTAVRKVKATKGVTKVIDLLS